MRRKVALYVAGRKVDIGDDTWILYNWTREDLANPTAVINSSSHQVELPGTCRNNAVLGSAFRLDRRTLFGSRQDGTYFDPMRKTPFTLYDADGTVLESGYCRLDAVDTHSRLHSYTLTLYGGLGSFFYALAMNEDGSARTLADLIWKDARGQDETEFQMQPRAEFVKEAWDVLRDGYDPDEAYFEWFWNVINFAPCYNGIPEDFDAKHAVSSRTAYGNVQYQYWEGGDAPVYVYKAGLECALLTFAEAHTEWEVCDLRWYLQRPVVSVKALVAACCDPRNNGGYAVTLDPTFFKDENPVYADAWITMPLIAKDYRSSYFSLADVLRSSKSPMKYLVDYCKIYGLLFLWDGEAKTVDIVTRATFYATAGTTDLSERVDRSQPVTQTPVLADKRWYQLGDGGKGEFVEQYKRDYGKGYAIQRIDTGYEFDAGTTVLTEGQTYQDAAEVLESDLLFASAYYPYGANKLGLVFPAYEEVTEELWNGDESITFPLRMYDGRIGNAVTVADVPAYPGRDWLPKLQLHAADNKAQAGADVLLVFSGIVDAPQVTQDMRKEYRLTNDSAAMTQLAGGPCWDLTRTGIALTSLPSFRRVVLSDRYITDSYEWGVPPVRPVPGISYPAGQDNSIYGKWWKAYLSDRYAADTPVLRCMADLRGLPVGQALLRRFYWLDGALWTMNAIRNHSLTSWDLTEVELVRVHDRHAYDTGPGSVAAHWLTVVPAADSYAFIAGGEALTFTVRSSSDWTLALSALAPWLTFSAQSGDSGTTVVTVTAVANDGEARRSVTVTLTNEDGDTLSFVLTQEPMAADTIRVAPASVTIPGAGGQASAEVESTAPWAVDPTTVPAWLLVEVSSAGISVTAQENYGTERTAQLKLYLTSNTDEYTTFAVVQLESTSGTGGINLVDAKGNRSAVAPADAGTLMLYLTAPAGAQWTVSEGVNWVSLSPASGTGDDTIAVTISANAGDARECAITAQRTGYAGSVTFYLHQEAAGGTNNYIEVTRYGNPAYNYEEYDASPTPGAGASIRASGAWTARTTDAWIHPAYTNVAPWSGNGNADIFFDIDANTGGARVGEIIATLTATGEESTFYVRQEGNYVRVLNAWFTPSSVGAGATTVDLNIDASEGLAWIIDNVGTGLQIVVASGMGSAVVSVGVAANTGEYARVLALRVRNAQYNLAATPSVTQAAPEVVDYLRVTPFGIVEVPAAEGVLEFLVESSRGWTAALSGDSGSGVSPASGRDGMSYVAVIYTANPGSTSRDLTLTITPTSGSADPVTVTIRQAAPTEEDLTVTPLSLAFSAGAGSDVVELDSTGPWVAATSDSWIRVSPASGPNGSYQAVTIVVTANTGPARSGHVTFSYGGITRRVEVSQASGEPVSVYPTAINIGADEGSTAYVTIFSPGSWVIKPPEIRPGWMSWLMPNIGGGTGGNAEGTRVTFTATAANTTGESRMAQITIALVAAPYTEITLTVTQAAE